METINPNVLITNYCNQNCEFCFASELMRKGKTREMSLKKFSDLLKFLAANKTKTVYLMGGEPTLHSHFKEMIELALIRGFKIEIFTNGNISEEIKNYLIACKSKIQVFHINISGPVYQKTENIKKINDFIRKISRYSQISLETTIADLEVKNFDRAFSSAEEIIRHSFVRIGVDGALVMKNGFNLKKNREIGKIIFNMIEKLAKKKIKGVWLCEVNACMFDEKQLDYIKKSRFITLSGYGCLGKRGSVDIKTDLRAIRCFGLDSLKGLPIFSKKEKKLSLLEIKQALDQKMVMVSKKKLPLDCEICKFYGVEEGKCPGPCLILRK